MDMISKVSKKEIGEIIILIMITLLM